MSTAKHRTHQEAWGTLGLPNTKHTTEHKGQQNCQHKANRGCLEAVAIPGMTRTAKREAHHQAKGQRQPPGANGRGIAEPEAHH